MNTWVEFRLVVRNRDCLAIRLFVSAVRRVVWRHLIRDSIARLCSNQDWDAALWTFCSRPMILWYFLSMPVYRLCHWVSATSYFSLILVET